MKAKTKEREENGFSQNWLGGGFNSSFFLIYT